MAVHFLKSYSQLAGLTVLVALFYFIFLVLSRPTSKLPGPWHSKWTDLVFRYQWFYGRQTFYTHDLHKKYGPIVRVAPNQVAVADLETVKSVYTIKETYRKTKFYELLVSQPIQTVFSTVDIELHRKLRRLMASQMSESSLKSMLPQVTSHVELAIQRMKEESKDRGVIDVFKWCLFMTTDVISELSFGESFQMLEKGKKTQYIEDLENISSVLADRVTFPFFFHLADKYDKILPLFRSKIAINRRLVEYSRQSLVRYQKQVESDATSAKYTFIEKLFQAEKDKKITFDDILTNAQGLVTAGSDTTAITLTYLIWSICKRPELRDALLKELQTLPGDFTEPDLRELPLFNQTVEETLRVYSSAPASLPRAVPQGGAHVGGYYLSEGTTVAAQAYTMHRDPAIFENPDVFDPQRWANPTKAMKEAFMPFGRGSRTCIGMHLAYIELRLAAARFLLEFPNARVSAREGMSDRDMDSTMHFLMSPKGKRCLIEE
ncbi:hypothetical protein E4U13_004517 [Claviceps humidiphila]|uniref:Cytochrome P450 n=1 Tax=Claviceps humidiphila TaxID=1294629 RepID=A0A9P7PX99_9HYPO|nr:hypothetical protein E4U13_004517 [Claviceps humidiphila]